MASKYFLPFCRLPLYFVDCFLFCTENVYFDMAPLNFFLFCCLYFFNIKVWLIYNVSSSSVVQQSDAITHISLCCTAGSYYSLIPNIIVGNQKIPKMPIHPIPPLSPLGIPVCSSWSRFVFLFVCLFFIFSEESQKEKDKYDMIALVACIFDVNFKFF